MSRQRVIATVTIPCTTNDGSAIVARSNGTEIKVTLRGESGRETATTVMVTPEPLLRLALIAAQATMKDASE